MTDDTGIVAFLKARLNEDESASWSIHDVANCDALLYEEDLSVAAANTPECDCGHPARVLREVEAKRKILAEHYILTNENRLERFEEFSVVPWGAKGGAGDQGSGCVTCHYYGMGGVKGYGICRTVRALAAVYSDHPDYEELRKP